MRRIYLLECGHRKSFESKRPRLHELLWCHACNDYTAIKDEPGSWAVFCLDCLFRRGNQGQLAAATYASSHMARRRHVVYSWRIGEYKKTLEKHIPTVKECHAGDSPPF